MKLSDMFRIYVSPKYPMSCNMVFYSPRYRQILIGDNLAVEVSTYEQLDSVIYKSIKSFPVISSINDIDTWKYNRKYKDLIFYSSGIDTPVMINKYEDKYFVIKNPEWFSYGYRISNKGIQNEICI